ncbi:glycosyltransferase family 2 protein [Streptacidiphilus cavernicola]|uniref:Hyaluronan synthase n=1 Tax=Streptacidiphilus cavernicola TaxID=3342716 RepID=A0ABV6VUP2_9ACTN
MSGLRPALPSTSVTNAQHSWAIFTLRTHVSVTRKAKSGMHTLIRAGAHLHWYGVTVGTLLFLKLVLSIRRRRKPELSFRHHSRGYYVHGVVTSYNEAPAMLRRCLDSILAQTMLVDSLTVVDDCSSDMSCAALIHDMRPQFERLGVRLDFIRFPDNRGKRHGLAAGFEQAPNADMYLCVDSDTVLDQHAVSELAEPFSKRRVHCVTGLVLAHNRSTNLLTRLIDMRYVNAFLGERVAYSRLGSVLCACGSLAMYRGWVVRKYLDDFLDQRFLGRPATFGDDRRLTYYCLTEGLSLIQPSSVGYTDVPERLNTTSASRSAGASPSSARASCSSGSSGSPACTGGST